MHQVTLSRTPKHVRMARYINAPKRNASAGPKSLLSLYNYVSMKSYEMTTAGVWFYRYELGREQQI